MWMNETFVSRCNKGEFHALFQRLLEDPAKPKQWYCNFGFRAADVTSAVIGNRDNNREAWDMGQKLPSWVTQGVPP
jgi:hypothetical protein